MFVNSAIVFYWMKRLKKNSSIVVVDTFFQYFHVLHAHVMSSCFCVNFYCRLNLWSCARFMLCPPWFPTSFALPNVDEITGFTFKFVNNAFELGFWRSIFRLLEYLTQGCNWFIRCPNLSASQNSIDRFWNASYVRYTRITLWSFHCFEICLRSIVWSDLVCCFIYKRWRIAISVQSSTNVFLFDFFSLRSGWNNVCAVV